MRGPLLRARVAILGVLVTTACASPYEPSLIFGGFRDSKVAPDVWRVTFAGNTMTSRDTAQTLWLYRAAELALEQGAAGFEIVASVEEDSSGELRLSMSANSSIVRQSSRRESESKRSVSASVTKPGLEPVL